MDKSATYPASQSTAASKGKPPSRPAISKPRVRDLGIFIGLLPPGPQNSIGDVPGVRVGHSTLVQGDKIRTGITCVLPHSGNLFREKVAGAVFVGNGFGKIAGATQVNELGEIETPILLTSTLNVGKVADGLVDYVLSTPGNEAVRSVNPLVAETNDGFLNDIRARPLGKEHVFEAIDNALRNSSGRVEEGCVGGGTGTVCFGYKGGIGTSSRILDLASGQRFTLGVLVQSNFGGELTVAGVPVERRMKDKKRAEKREKVAHPPTPSTPPVSTTSTASTPTTTPPLSPIVSTGPLPAGSIVTPFVTARPTQSSGSVSVTSAPASTLSRQPSHPLISSPLAHVSTSQQLDSISPRLAGVSSTSSPPSSSIGFIASAPMSTMPKVSPRGPALRFRTTPTESPSSRSSGGGSGGSSGPGSAPGPALLKYKQQQQHATQQSALGQPLLHTTSQPPPQSPKSPNADVDGSCVIVLATDAPLDHRLLHRLGMRAMMGMGRVGAAGSNGSGDYVIAFSTAAAGTRPLSNDISTLIFQAVIEATEEAILNSLFAATDTSSNGKIVEAIPAEKIVDVLRWCHAINS